MLGSLIMGLPATVYSSINGSQLMIAAKDPTFMTHLMSTSRVVHQTFVSQVPHPPDVDSAAAFTEILPLCCEREREPPSPDHLNGQQQ